MVAAANTNTNGHFPSIPCFHSKGWPGAGRDIGPFGGEASKWHVGAPLAGCWAICSRQLSRTGVASMINILWWIPTGRGTPPLAALPQPQPLRVQKAPGMKEGWGGWMWMCRAVPCHAMPLPRQAAAAAKGRGRGDGIRLVMIMIICTVHWPGLVGICWMGTVTGSDLAINRKVCPFKGRGGANESLSDHIAVSPPSRNMREQNQACKATPLRVLGT